MTISDRILKTIEKIALERNIPEDDVTYNQIAVEQAIELNNLFDMRIVGYTFNDKHTANHDRKKCNCQELAFKVDSLRIENEPEAESHFVNDRLVCWFKH